MNRNVRSVESGARKANTKTTPGLHSSYMQRFLSTAAHKNLESALQQKLNFAFNKQRAVTPSRKELEIDLFDDDDDRSPRYLNPKEKVAGKKLKKKSPGSSPRTAGKGKTKETTAYLPQKATIRQSHVMHKEAAKVLRESTHPIPGNKLKDAVGEVPKKSKVKGPNTLLHREPIVELPTVSAHPLRKGKEPTTPTKERMKDVPVKVTGKKEAHAKGDKKVSDTQKKGMVKTSVVKASSRRVQ